MSDEYTLGSNQTSLDSTFKHDPTSASSGSAPLSSSTTSASSGSAPTANGTPTASGQNAAASLQNAKDNVVNSASATMSNINNSQTVQDLKNGPVAQSVFAEASKTGSEFQDLANSRQTPKTTAANGQTLTNYHSFFYRLLSWQNPRATAITFSANIILIFMARYLNILSYFFKFSFIILGVTSGLEIAGKILFDDGLASKMRPRKYWTIPRESLERMTEDVEQLINFFVIESQRILYAENVYATLAAFSAAFLSYWLIRLVPFWGMTLISTFVVYLAPLVYIKNREAIDNGLNHASDVIGTQASQIKNMTVERTNNATKSVQSYAGEYSSKASEYMGAKKNAVSNSTSGPTTSINSSNPINSSPSANSTSSSLNTSSSAVRSNDFPAAPQQAPVSTGSTSSLAQSTADPLYSQ